MMAAILPRFRTRSLWLADPADSAPELRSEQQLQTLTLPRLDSLGLEEIRGLPNLRHLDVSTMETLQGIRLPAGLEGLRISAGAVDLSRLGDLPRLRTLILTFSKWSGPSDLAALKQLRWLGLPTNATQTEFAAIVLAHPDLEVLELGGVEGVTDLSPLRALPRLEAVTLDGAYDDLGVLRDLTSLRFIGLSRAIWENSPDQVAAIRAALPRAAVVKVTPFCLGSGWILLLIPAVILMLFIPARRGT
jgi:hypothetical protein